MPCMEEVASTPKPYYNSPHHFYNRESFHLLPVMITGSDGGFGSRVLTLSQASDEKKTASYLLNLPNYHLLYLKDINGDVSLNSGPGGGLEEVSQAFFHD